MSRAPSDPRGGWQPGAPDERPEPQGPPPAVAVMTDGEWHRLHPATPLLKGGIVFVVILGYLAANLREQLVQLFVPNQGGPSGPNDGDPVDFVVGNGLIWLVIAGVAVLLLILIGIFYLSWRMSTFRVTAESVEVRSGIVFRTNRRARLDRIQGINIERKLLPRLFGAAKLEINQAGNDANVPLAYLRSATADDVRREILRRASGTRESEDRDARSRAGGGKGHADSVTDPRDGVVEQRLNEFLAAPLGEDDVAPHSVVTMKLTRLIGSAVLSGFTLFLVVIVVAVIVSIVTTGQYFLLFVFLPTLLGSFSYYSRRIVKSLRYSIAATRDGIRIGWGLISTSNETLPPGRIHSIKLSQPLLWRPFGWWEVKINRASHSRNRGADNQANTTILPVGSADDVRRVLELVLPELVGLTAADVDVTDSLARGETSAAEVVAAQPSRAVEESGRTLSLIEAGMTLTGSEGGFTTSPRRAAILRWFSWRRNGFRTAPGALLLRKGAIWRQLIVVPLPRLQSVGVRQGPLLRRLRLADIELHTVQGPIDANIGALDQDEARDFFITASRDAVSAARADRTHRWLEGAAGAEGEPFTAPPWESAASRGAGQSWGAPQSRERLGEDPGREAVPAPALEHEPAPAPANEPAPAPEHEHEHEPAPAPKSASEPRNAAGARPGGGRHAGNAPAEGSER